MYRRILLKLSGEALKGGNQKQILDVSCLKSFADVIKKLHDDKVEICIVIGAGNIWRGKLAKDIGIEPVPADFMGMLGTVINAVALSSSLKENYQLDTVVYSAIPAIDGVSKPYNIKEADEDLKNGKIVFLAGGTGKPFFTTDTAAALRAKELHCEAIFMGKNGVEGVYDKDPTQFKDAKFIKSLSFDKMIEMNLQIMDISAVELIKDTDIKVRIFSMSEPVNFIKVAHAEDIGTTMERK